MKLTLSLALLVLASVSPADETRPALEQTRGPAKLTVTVDRLQPEPTVGLATLITLTLTVAQPGPLEVELLEPIGPTASWQIMEKQAPQRNEEGNHWQQRFVVMATHPSEAVALQPPGLRYRTGQGEWQKVAWGPMTLKVLSHIANLDEATPRGVTGIEELPSIDSGWRRWLWIGLGVVAVGGLVGVIGLVVWRRGKPRQPPTTAQERALRQLARLAAIEPATPRAYQKLHFLLAKVLRRFVQAKWGLPALQLTTAEFLSQVQTADVFSTEQQAKLADILTQCDLAKFCPAKPDPAAFAKQLQNTRDLVDALAVQSNPPILLHQPDA